MPTPKTTASFKLPALDKHGIARKERDRVERIVQAASSPEEVLRITAAIVKQADEELKARRRRDMLALSLRLYGNARAMNVALGISRTAFVDKVNEALQLSEEEQGTWMRSMVGEPAEQRRAKLIERARQMNVKEVDTDAAVRLLPKLAERVYRAQVAKDTAMPFRNAAVRELVAAGWSRQEIADVISTLPMRVSQVRRLPQQTPPPGGDQTEVTA